MDLGEYLRGLSIKKLRNLRKRVTGELRRKETQGFVDRTKGKLGGKKGEER